MRLKPEWSFQLNVFEFFESFINVFKQIYPDIIEFARQIARQIPFCKDDLKNNQTVVNFPCGYIHTKRNY